MNREEKARQEDVYKCSLHGLYISVIYQHTYGTPQSVAGTAVSLDESIIYNRILQQNITTEHYNRIFTKYLDRSIDFVIVLDSIKGSNLRLKICVCSVVSTVETSGAAGKW